jgi:outer membrane protein TolC
VLTAETAVLAQRRQQADLLAQAISSQVGVAQAMGGGWQPTPAAMPGLPADASPAH